MRELYKNAYSYSSKETFFFFNIVEKNETHYCISTIHYCICTV